MENRGLNETKPVSTFLANRDEGVMVVLSYELTERSYRDEKTIILLLTTPDGTYHTSSKRLIKLFRDKWPNVEPCTLEITVGHTTSGRTYYDGKLTPYKDEQIGLPF